jgi:hypothetical protein
MQLIKPSDYNADGIDCKTFWVTERDIQGYITLIWEWEPLPYDLKEHVLKAIADNKNYCNPPKHTGVIEIKWD